MRFEFIRGTSKKFWEASVEGLEVLVRWGRLGTTGQTKRHAVRDARRARELMDSLISEKTKKGYQRVDAPAAPPREPRLEAAMFDAPDDPGPALVYADWLQAAGNPWGELIAVQHALEQGKTNKTLKAREKALLKDLPLPAKDLGTVTWKRGCLETVHLFNERDWMDDGYDVLAVVRPLFDLPMCGGLRELRTGVIRWEGNATDVPAVLAEAATRPFAKRLRRLVLGDIADSVDMDHHVIGDVRLLSKQFPNLEALTLHSGASTWSGTHNFEFGPLDLPRLRRLCVETCAMSKKRLAQVLTSALPALTELELWFGAPDRDGTARLKDLAPLLSGTVLPRVTSLGLKNLEFSDALATALGASKLAARLERLDLSMGTLGGEGVTALCKTATSFTSLRELNVSDSYVSDDELKQLKRAFPKAAVNADDPKALDPEDEDPKRYCSVHE
jgi:uncharacterized protein (TIGR02996 family)